MCAGEEHGQVHEQEEKKERTTIDHEWLTTSCMSRKILCGQDWTIIWYPTFSASRGRVGQKLDFRCLNLVQDTPRQNKYSWWTSEPGCHGKCHDAGFSATRTHNLNDWDEKLWLTDYSAAVAVSQPTKFTETLTTARWGWWTLSTMWRLSLDLLMWKLWLGSCCACLVAFNSFRSRRHNKNDCCFPGLKPSQEHKILTLVCEWTAVRLKLSQQLAFQWQSLHCSPSNRQPGQVVTPTAGHCSFSVANHGARQPVRMKRPLAALRYCSAEEPLRLLLADASAVFLPQVVSNGRFPQGAPAQTGDGTCSDPTGYRWGTLKINSVPRRLSALTQTRLWRWETGPVRCQMLVLSVGSKATWFF